MLKVWPAVCMWEELTASNESGTVTNKTSHIKGLTSHLCWCISTAVHTHKWTWRSKLSNMLKAMSRASIKRERERVDESGPWGLCPPWEWTSRLIPPCLQHPVMNKKAVILLFKNCLHWGPSHSYAQSGPKMSCAKIIGCKRHWCAKVSKKIIHIYMYIAIPSNVTWE